MAGNCQRRRCTHLTAGLARGIRAADEWFGPSLLCCRTQSAHLTDGFTEVSAWLFQRVARQSENNSLFIWECILAVTICARARFANGRIYSRYRCILRRSGMWFDEPNFGAFVGITTAWRCPRATHADQFARGSSIIARPAIRAERCARSWSNSVGDRQCRGQLKEVSLREQLSQRNRGGRAVTVPNSVATR